MLPNFSEKDILSLKKYFEFNERYKETVNQEMLLRLKDHPLWAPMINQMTPEQMEMQRTRSGNLQRAAIYEGKWEDYAKDLLSQGRMYARMNVDYNEWYELITLAKVLLIPYIKKDPAVSVVDAIDIIDGLSKFVDYAMYGIAVAYFLEKNEIIRTEQERFKMIFDNSDDIILLLNTEGKVLAINHGGRYEPGEIIGKNIFDFQESGNAERMKAAFKEAFEKKVPTTFEAEVASGDIKIYYAGKISPVLNHEKEVTSAVVVSRDVTAQKKAELNLVSLNAHLEQRVMERTAELDAINKELESFTYSVSHDLRSPLRAINGFSEILREEHAGKLNEDAEDALKEIIGNVRRMGQLIDDLLHFSRLGKQNISSAVVDMKELTHSVVEDLKKQYPEVTFKISGLPDTHGDRAMLKQVMQNLVSNAAKYSSKTGGPVVEIGAKEEKAGPVYFVKDNGVGFNMAYYDKLFGVFQRLHSTSEFEGTGVGLAIVKRIISKHSGRVWAESKEDEGATFYISLPRPLQ